MDLATDVVFLDLVAQVCNGRVCRVVRAEYFNCLLDLVRAVDIIDYDLVSI